MVLLTMTPSIVEALQYLPGPLPGYEARKKSDAEAATQTTNPSLAGPEVGKPISHGQIVDIWTTLKASSELSMSLEQLLLGAQVYLPPPPPKPEPVSSRLSMQLWVGAS